MCLSAVGGSQPPLPFPIHSGSRLLWGSAKKKSDKFCPLVYHWSRSIQIDRRFVLKRLLVVSSVKKDLEVSGDGE